tara:strand:+ start:24167 stop:24463 length:297 start_codon:yes stop_codon:yes gene_type:complete
MDKANDELINSADINSSKSNKDIESNKPQKKFSIENKINPDARWVDNKGNEVKEVFGFNDNAELVNSRAAMAGFLMLILTELVFKGEAATKSIFGIGL